jgi:two-component system NtrC family sensor kinase
MKDITDRRIAERRYRRERDFNKNILNNTQSMILVLDTAGLISYANRRCFESGYRDEDLLGRPLIEMVPAARRPLLVEALERTLHGAALDNLEIPIFRGGGPARQFSVSVSPMRDELGDINSIVVVMTDITDASDLQSKLMHTEKMAALGQLVSGVAHEVNNPLAAIVGFTDLLLENAEIPGEAKEELKIILQEAQRTRVIVQNLLSFARQMPAQREPLQVNSVLRQTMKLRAYDFSNHGVELIEDYVEDLPAVIGDPSQLQQVFLNIINNAYDAVQETRRAGKIKIATAHRDGRVEISFRDNGPGISKMDRIFDPFFTTKEVGKGTGLGLSICYGIIRAHNGEILARNNTDGFGSTFLVRLPAAETAAGFHSAAMAERAKES